jgi:hypothetical protein
MARLGFSQRQNREADFLVCDKGMWGILLVQYFDAGECWENPDGVVNQLLYLLRIQK